MEVNFSNFANPDSELNVSKYFAFIMLLLFYYCSDKKERELFAVEENQWLNVKLEMWSYSLRCNLHSSAEKSFVVDFCT